MFRGGLAPLFGLVLGVVLVASPGQVRAQPASPPASVAQPPPEQPPVAEPDAGQPAAPARAAGIELLASMGWGASTQGARKMELSPYGASFGLDGGYAWRSGFRLGGYVGYSLGRSVSQTYDPLVGSSFDMSADTSSLNMGLSVDYDVPLQGFVLRYALGIGVTAMFWEFGSEAPRIANYSESPAAGFHLAPGGTLFWPHNSFLGGVGFRYLAQFSDSIPSGFLGELLVGVRL